MTLADVHDVSRLHAVVTRHLGLHIEDNRFGMLGDVLRHRLEELHVPADTYLTRLEAAPGDRAELRMLAAEITIGETYFFRNTDQFTALRDIAIPDRMRSRATGGARCLRLLSAGCASGDEAYSLAIVLRELGEELAGWTTEVRAVDVNPGILDRARLGRYTAWALRETPLATQRRWFTAVGREYVLADAVRSMVMFEERNLAVDDPALWPPATYDVIFCRNVMMYFSPDQAAALIARIGRALVPDGYLFLGHAETLRGLSQDFHLRHTHGTFYYQRKDGMAPASAEEFPAVSPHRFAPPRVPLMAVIEATDSWVEAIRDSSERIRALAAGVGPRTARVDVTKELGRAVALLQEERYVDALRFVDALPTTVAEDPEVLLLRAVLLTHGGALADAERACHTVLSLDEFSAGAHYLLALCREGLGDRRGAGEHDQVAVYLDATFAMPQLHLGLLARRGGDREAARRALTRALILLQREDSSRLLLFGGGFTRDTLVALCRAELVACGGADA